MPPNYKVFQTLPGNPPPTCLRICPPWSPGPKISGLKSPGAQLVFLPPSLLHSHGREIQSSPPSVWGPGSLGLAVAYGIIFIGLSAIVKTLGEGNQMSPSDQPLPLCPAMSSCSRLSSQSIPFILDFSVQYPSCQRRKGCSIPDIRGKI